MCPEDPWKSKLINHEFDHVSISTDPRMQALLKRILALPIRFRLPLDNLAQSPLAPIYKPEIEKKIQSEVRARVVELERIIQAHYDLLDQTSDHGNRDIADRMEMFSTFFTPDTLEKMGFGFPEQAKETAKASQRINWKEHYPWNPTQ